ncbi:MAG TPA: class I SAM-dependent methyltransferase [Acidimicrobiales bacterium]|jgi:SAM-dependent methyltransferase|nr:class I SAM-dependent methyltransferase [Acidimicrobiales bacterium]
MANSVPEMNATPLMACPSCGSLSARVITLGTHELKKCRDCHLVYAPSFADPEEIYVEGYFSGEKGAFGLDTRHPEFDEFLDFVAARRMDILEQVSPAPGRILDVGCGPGHTLAEAKRRGWEACGVDLVPDAVAIAVERYGLDVRNSLLEDSDFPERSFDVVAATHVLEHQQDGAGFLASIARWVRPGGHLFIEVPNWSSADRYGNGQQWYGLRPYEHLGHYSPQTLARTMERLGFAPVAIATPCFQFPQRQTLVQALHDLGLTRVAPFLNRDALTVAGTQRDEVVRLPNQMMRRILHGAERVLDAAKLGVVIVMVAQVP